MKPLFVYGTLRDAELLSLVLGRTNNQITAAALSEYTVCWVLDQPFPMIFVDAGATAFGPLVDVSVEDTHRVNFYEGGFGYDLVDVTVQTDAGPRDAQVYVPRPGLWTQGCAWDLAAWQAEWGAITREAAKEVMSYYGRFSAADVAARFNQIRIRADARVRAARITPAINAPKGPGRDAVRLHEHRRPYSEFFTFEEVDVQFPRFDGELSQKITRGVYVGGDSALVLPYDPVSDQVLVIQQFRAGPYVRGDDAPWVLEPVAGRIDLGETAEQAARREAMEEAGLDLSALHLVNQGYASPGSTSEFFHVFVGCADLAGRNGTVGGVSEEDEDIRSHVMPYETFEALLDNDGIRVAPLALAGQWLARNRDRLRGAA